MAFQEGKIKKIWNNKFDAPKVATFQGKTFSTTFNHKLVLDGVDGIWDLGDDNSPTPYLKSCGELHEGDVIEFMYKTSTGAGKNGTTVEYRKINKPSVSIKVKGTGENKPSTSTGGTTSTGTGQSKSGSPNPASVGQCLNIALLLGILNKDNLSDPNQQRHAIQMYNKVFSELSDLWDAALNEPTPRVEVNDKDESSTHPDQEGFDDDIPF